MNLTQLEVLVAIVDTGSLTEAGEIVGLTQSAVSYSLSKLEAELGVTLLERGRQGVTVTRIGEDVLVHARNILTQVEVIRQKTARERGMSVGKIRFGCVPTIPPRLLTGILRDFQHKYPEIEVVLFEGSPVELVEWLDTELIDIGTVLHPENYALSVPLVRDEMKVVLSADNPLADQSNISINDLIQQPLIGPKAEYGIMRELLNFENWTPPRLRYEVSTQNTILAMVRENMGVSIIPDMLVDREYDDIKRIPFTQKRYLNVWLGATVNAPAISEFLQMANSWAREHGYLVQNIGSILE